MGLGLAFCLHQKQKARPDPEVYILLNDLPNDGFPVSIYSDPIDFDLFFIEYQFIANIVRIRNYFFKLCVFLYFIRDDCVRFNRV